MAGNVERLGTPYIIHYKSLALDIAWRDLQVVGIHTYNNIVADRQIKKNSFTSIDRCSKSNRFIQAHLESEGTRT